MNSTEYGIQTKTLKLVTIICGFIGVFVFGFFAYYRFQDDKLKDLGDWIYILVGSVAVAGILPGFLALQAVIKLRISGQYIEQVFLGGRVLKRKMIIELDHLKWDTGLSAVTLYFKDGSTMRLLALPLWERHRFQSELEKSLGYSLAEE